MSTWSVFFRMSEWSRNVTLIGMLVPDGVVCISQKQLISREFHTQQSLEFAENGEKNKKHPVSSDSASRNPLLMREVRGEGPEWSKPTGR